MGRFLRVLLSTFIADDKINITKLVRGFLGQAYRGITGGFLLLRIFSMATSVSPHVCFVLDIIFISMFLR